LLRQQCAQRAPLFAPEKEQREVNRLLVEAVKLLEPAA
jgi:hypothetical protein